MNAVTAEDDQPFRFAEGTSEPHNPLRARVWRILIIDDDADVHAATLFSLSGQHPFGRPLEFLHAYSARESREKLLTEPDLALVLLDVVMETANAGLELVDFIRNTAKLTSTRVVLRTGQPGFAPEHDTLLHYDINDYKTKSELTHHKLLTTVTAALRCYDQLCTIEASRKGLTLIVEASGNLLQAQSLHSFATGVISRIAALLGSAAAGLVCTQTGPDRRHCTVLAATGRFTGWIDQPLPSNTDGRISELLLQVLANGRSHYGECEAVLYLGEKNGFAMVACLETALPLLPLDCQLLDVFCANLGACLRNQLLLQQLHTDAYVDPLLRLPNRTRFIEEAGHCLGSGGNEHSMALVDIDDFAAVNDLMGHPYGDLLLQAFAQLLIEQLGRQVTVARVSGNAFGLLGPSRCLTGERITAALQAPVRVAGQPHRIAVTTGIAECDAVTVSGADWLKNASIALKHAKKQHRGRYAYYSADMAAQARSRAQLLASLHTAFGEDRLFLAYQPQVDLGSGELVGLEALLRWRAEDGRMVPPDQFIPVSEQSGLIVSLGDWILQTACHDMHRLQQQGLAHCRMAVNVSVVQFQSPGFLNRVMQTLQQSGLAAEQLELEITESVAMLGSDVVAELLLQLRATGVSVAIDDFGTGYSSLSYLDKLPLDRIKIDRTFVNQIRHSGGLRIAEMVTQLGDKLGLRVIAEGIEDALAWNALRAMGCHEGQGYFIARPLDFEALRAWLPTRPQNPQQFGVV